MNLIELLKVIKNDEPFRLLNKYKDVVTDVITLENASAENLQKVIILRDTNVLYVTGGNYTGKYLMIVLDLEDELVVKFFLESFGS